MSFGGLILTNSGRNLLAKAQAGIELKFTRVGLGDGTLGVGSITELKALRNEVKPLNITNLEVVESNAEVTTFLSNANMTEGFYLREIGIFALDPDLGEVLYCYDNSGMDADYIPPEGEVIIERNMRFSLIVSNASSVTATINSSLVFATKQELEALKDSVDEEIGNIEDLQTESKTLTGAINELERDKADKTYVDGAMENIEVPVTSVNNKTGDVSLTAGDVGASPTGHSHTYSEITGKPSTFPPSSHEHAKSEVGLGNVQDYGVATEAQAKAGTANNRYMTPLRVKEAIQHLAQIGGISMVKSVQRGVSDMGNKASLDVSISPVNASKAMLNYLGFTYSENNASSVHSYRPHLRLLDSTTIRIERGESNASVPLSWEVVEFY